MDQFIQWCNDNWTTLLYPIGVIIVAWAKVRIQQSIAAQKSAPILVQAIEDASTTKGAKTIVGVDTATGTGTLVADFVDDLVAKLDKAKPNPTKKQIFVRELVRGIPLVARLARKFLLPTLLLCAAVGCASLPQITTVAPDGTTTARVDTEALASIAQIATQSAQTLMTFISDMETRKAEAEARGDVLEAAKWDKQAALARESLAILLEAFPPKGVVVGPGTSSEATSGSLKGEATSDLGVSDSVVVGEKVSLTLPEAP